MQALSAQITRTQLHQDDPSRLSTRLATLGNGRGGYLAFLGRISPEKGADATIRIAQRAMKRLIIAAKVDPADCEYLAKNIKHLLDLPHIEYIGEINGKQKGTYLGNAAALLFPITWPEPFRLEMVEAMMYSTP